MRKVYVTVTKIEFDHDGELSAGEVLALEQQVLNKTYIYDEDDYDDTCTVTDQISDETGWCIADIDLTAELK